MIDKTALAKIFQQLGTDETLIGKGFKEGDLKFEVMRQKLVV